MSAPAHKEKAEPRPAGPSVDPERARQLRLLWWKEARFSLWTPVTVFGVVLLLYTAMVEFHTPASRWGAPALKGFGLVMLTWMAALWATRLVSRAHHLLRKRRRDGRELSLEVRRLLAKYAAKIDPKHLKRLADQLEALDAARLRPDPDRLGAEMDKLAELAQKHLPSWRRGTALGSGLGIAKALAIALLIRTVAIEPYRIPSGSMIPTLEIGDQIFVNKFIYGVRIPFTNWVPFVIAREPQRGDIIVFEKPGSRGWFWEREDLVKRVVAVPGDVVEARDHQLFINGQLQPGRVVDPRHLVHDKQIGGPWEDRRLALVEETLDGKAHPVLHEEQDVFGPISFTVPPRHVFVMGDNRDHSSDGRVGFANGPPAAVPYGNIKGKAMVVWLCLGYDGLMSRLFDGTGFRTDRLFTPVR